MQSAWLAVKSKPFLGFGVAFLRISYYFRSLRQPDVSVDEQMTDTR